jgi:O-acetyl-ADP-ribose deacetylase (regulator of RNase III)
MVNIEFVQGNITHQEVDAIVNAANSSLMGGGGVDGAIHHAGGPAILEECKQIRKLEGECAPGKAVITGGGNLKARFVIHTVGPIWRGGQSSERSILANAYRNSLLLAVQYECKTVAFPSISTGAYGFPVKLAAPIAISTITTFLAEHGAIETVRLVLFDRRTLEEYQRASLSHELPG